MRMFILASLLFTFACNDAADLQAKATEAQTKANEKTTAAAMEAKTEAKAAQASAVGAIADANESFQKMREDYRHGAAAALQASDAKVTDLRAAAVKATGRDKVARQDRLNAIDQRRLTYLREYDALENATMSTWDASKASVDMRFKELTDAVAAG